LPELNTQVFSILKIIKAKFLDISRFRLLTERCRQRQIIKEFVFKILGKALELIEKSRDFFIMLTIN